MFVYYYKHLDKVLYVGSTGNLKKRECTHKKDLQNCGSPFYKYLREHTLTFNDLNKTVLQAGNVDRTTLRQFEKAMIYMLNPLYNMISPIQTEEERKEYQTEYLQEYQKNHKEQHNRHCKKYRENNKEMIQENYEKNKEKISEIKKVKVHCDICNVDIRKSDIARHNKSNKHLQNSK